MRGLKFLRKTVDKPVDPKKIFFFHLPKCAGTSVWGSLGRLVDKEKVFQVSSLQLAEAFDEMPASQRSAYDAIGGHFELDRYREHLDLDRYVCVTTFRDPVQRILSEYYYALHNTNHSHHSIIAQQTLADFVQWRPNPITQLICGKPDAKAAHETVLDVFDHWCFVEEVDDLVRLLYRQAGKPVRSAPHLNVGPQSKRSSAVDRELLKLIREHHHADLELGALLRETRAGMGSRSAIVAAPAKRSTQNPPAVFRIVTPVFNGARYVDETIASVVGQAGDFIVHYHIQDGGSTDGTLEIARRWQSRVSAADFPQRCKGMHLTIDCRADAGMYDAIAAGFRSLAPASSELMTWINADDRLAPGALAAVADAFRDIPRAELIGGRHALIDAEGKGRKGSGTIGYPRGCIAAGLHDGRHLPFIMQEGTFWRAALWDKVGGIDTSFKLAGDWDLWRRFAAETDYVTLDAMTGCHRRHPGQLTESLVQYHREIDDRLAEQVAARDASYRQYTEAWLNRTPMLKTLFSVRVARRGKTGRWEVAKWSHPRPLTHAPLKARRPKPIQAFLQRSYRWAFGARHGGPPSGS